MTTDSKRPLPGFAADSTPEEVEAGRAIGAANRAYFETEGHRTALLAVLQRCGFVTALIGCTPGGRISIELQPAEAERLIGILAAVEVK